MRPTRVVSPILLGVVIVLMFGRVKGNAGAEGPALREADLNADGAAYEVNPDSQGNLWISDLTAGEVWQINPNSGAYTVFHGATNVSDARRDAAGNVWWTDYDNNRLGRISPSSSQMTTWSLPGSGNPLGTAIDSLGLVWITDTTTPVVHYFNPTNTSLCTYVVPDEGSSEYVLADAGRIWLGDWRQERILRLDPASNVYTIWQLPTFASPEGLTGDANGDLWWADTSLGELARLEPAINRLTRYSVPVGIWPEMLIVNGGSVWYTEDSDGSVGVLNPSVADGVTSTALRTTASVTPSCSTLGSGSTSSVTTSTGVASWTAGSMILQTDSAGWTVYQLPVGASPWGIAVNNGRVWIVDSGRQVLAWLCYWADLDCGCSVGAEDLAKAAKGWRCGIGDTCYNPRADQNTDDTTDVQDLTFFAGELGWTCQP